MSGSMKANKAHIEKFQKALSEMTPERVDSLSRSFAAMKSQEEYSQPLMRRMAFGGDCSFDANRKQVELSGEFSKEDLFRIALTMI